MDIAALQKIIASDVASNRTPLFLIADAGASLCGHIDNIMRLQDVCKANQIWLHCRGHSLAAIAITQGTGGGEVIADSISLNLGSWLGIPNLPVAVCNFIFPCYIFIFFAVFFFSYCIVKFKMLLYLCLNQILYYPGVYQHYHCGQQCRLLDEIQYLNI